MQRITQKLVVPKTVRVGATANNQEVNNNQEVKSGETLLEELTALYNGGGINKDEALLLLAALESEKTPQQVLKEGQYPEMQVKIDGFRLNIDQTNIISTHLSGEGKIVKLFNSWKPHMEKPSGLFSHSTKHTVYFNAAYKILRIAAGIDHAKGFKVQLDGFMQYYTLKEDSTTTIYAIREFNNCIAGILSEQKRGGDSQMYYAHSETTLRLLKDTDQSVIFKVVINNRSNLRDLILNLFNAEKIKQIYGTILQLQYGLDQIEDLLLHRLG
ncbi:MAG: hypothetical protein KBD37_08525, partial [Burkholderiales bacterium]|nr:hypothetical protein [Burkholderiales bacterium]